MNDKKLIAFAYMQLESKLDRIESMFNTMLQVGIDKLESKLDRIES